MDKTSYNFIHGVIDFPETQGALFGLLDPTDPSDEFIIFYDSRGADALVAAKCSSSKGEARRNLPNIKDTSDLTDWHDITVGKRKTRICLLGRLKNG